MQYVYILQSSADDNLYVGCTSDLRKRLLLHNAGKVQATKNRRPMKVIYYEALMNKKDAFEREKFLKTGWGRTYIRRVMKNHFSQKI